MFVSTSILEVQRWRYSGYGAAGLIALGVWSASLFGLFGRAGGALFDVAWGQVAKSRPLPAGVLLVELSERGALSSEEVLLEVMDRMLALGARQIVFDHIPECASGRFYERACRAGNVVLGRRIVFDPEGGAHAHRLEELPDGARCPGIAPGVAHIPPAAMGIYREQNAFYRIQGLEHPAIELLASQAFGGAALEPSPAAYLIAFRGGPGSLPLLDERRILEGEVVPELVRGKCVLLGRAAAGLQSGLETTMTRHGQRMSALEFHGHALNTLLSGRVIGRLGVPALLLLLAAQMFVSVLIYQWSETRFSSWLTIFLVLAYAGVAYLLLQYRGLWLPLAELGAAQGVLFVYYLRQRAISAGAAIKLLLLSSSGRLRDKYLPPQARDAAECWSLIINMINQTLELNRAIFLEAVEGKHVVREVKALNCSLREINESRRDYQRTPYVTALEAGGPIRVEKYLKRAYENEEQYLVPLSFAGEVLGFWAFGVDAEKLGATPLFKSMLRDYATMISEILYQRRQATRALARRRLGRYLTLDRNEEAYSQLTATLQTLETRMMHVEALLGGINTATVLYDLFGRIVHINTKMLEILEREKLDAYRMTALDLVAALSEYDLGKSKRVLRHVIIEQQVLTLPVMLQGAGKSRYLMHLHPLGLGKESGNAAESDLGTKSVLCELIDATVFTGLFEMKEKLTARLGLQLRNDLASIDLSSSLLGKSELSEKQRSMISQVIHEKVAKTLDVLAECQQYLSQSAAAENIERFPVDSQEHFAAALEEVQPALGRRGLGVELEQPKVMSYVLASSPNIQKLFTAVMRLLIADALDGSALRIAIREDEDSVTYAFSNTGFGLPNERFQAYIFGDRHLATEELKALKEASLWVEGWGGALEAESEVGMGIRVELRLVKFI
jgi:hypothetical protein